MSFQEYLALWDQIYVWCEGEREKFIEGARQYAEQHGTTLEDIRFEKDQRED